MVASIVSAFHRNWIGIFETLSAYQPRVRCWREPGMVMAHTGWHSATFNGALIEDQAMLTPARLREIERYFSDYGQMFSIQLCDTRSDPPIREMLEDMGYSLLLCDPLMIYNGAFAPQRVNAAVTIREAVTQADLETYYATVAEGFDLPPVREDFVETMLHMDESIHLIAEIYGRPVGAGTVVLCAGVAGVYNVTTLPASRGRGIGTAIMVALHKQALDHGYPGTALASSVMGLPLYNRLGYHPDGYQIVYMRVEE